MKVIGSTLFEAAELGSVLLANMTKTARDIVFDRVAHAAPVTRLALRRAIVPAVMFHDELELEVPGPVEPAPPGEADEHAVAMSCAIPFEGDGQLFQLSAPLWPRPRPVNGTVEGQTLRLTAEGRRGDKPWMPALLGAELAVVEQVVAEQARVAAAYNRGIGAHVRTLVERVYPRIDREALVGLADYTGLIAADDPTFPLLLLDVERERRRMWRQWTR